MNSVVAAWRNFKFGRKCAKLGRGCRFVGKDVTIDGHVEVGDFCRFRDHVIMRTNGNGRIVLGNRVGVTNYCIIEAADLVQIGDWTALAEFVVVRDTTHLVRGTDATWIRTPRITKPVIIGSGCWIGSRTYIGPGITIGDGVVVGVGSVVTKDIPPYEVWAGAPARFLYHRTKDVPPEIQAETDRLIAEQGIRPNRYEDG
jgi:acetyltransferase-like isoleucine patch superfamily enzyme